jgi:hypothetical protein
VLLLLLLLLLQERRVKSLCFTVHEQQDVLRDAQQRRQAQVGCLDFPTAVQGCATMVATADLSQSNTGQSLPSQTCVAAALLLFLLFL